MATILLVSVLISLVFAPTGCLILWKKYVYYADGLAHASLLAVALSIVTDLSIFYTGVINTIFFITIVFLLKNRADSNAAIGLTSSFMLSIAMLISGNLDGDFDFESILFGELSNANITDIYPLIGLGLCNILFFGIFYKQIILSVLSKDIASSRGIKIDILEIIFLSLLSFSVLISIKIVGALLVISIILVPAMTASGIANTPLKMIMYAMFFALFMNINGVMISSYYDLPYGPVISCFGIIIYFLSNLVKIIRSK